MYIYIYIQSIHTIMHTIIHTTHMLYAFALPNASPIPPNRNNKPSALHNGHCNWFLNETIKE